MNKQEQLLGRIPTVSTREAVQFFSERGFAWLYLAAMAVAELLSAYGHPIAGSIIYALILLAVLYLIAGSRGEMNALLVAFTPLPLIRVLIATLPLGKLPAIYWYLLTGSVLLLSGVMAVRAAGFTWRQLGLASTRRAIPTQLGIALAGFGLGWVEYQILRPQSPITDYGPAALLVAGFTLLIAVGVAEELVFRGLLQRAAVDKMGLGAGILFVSLLFAVMHVGYRSSADLLFVFAVGLLFGWLVARTGNLWGVILAHGLTNLVLFLVMPYLVLHPQDPAARYASAAIWIGTAVAAAVIGSLVSRSFRGEASPK